MSNEEDTRIKERLTEGVWAEGDYVVIQKTFIYETQELALDRYVIFEPGETWQIYNWVQHFTPQNDRDGAA